MPTESRRLFPGGAPNTRFAAKPEVTSPTVSRGGRVRLCGPHSSSGFTLLEMLVAFAVVGLLLALMPVAYQKLQASVSYHALVRGLVEQASAARLKAMASGEPAVLQLDMVQRRYGVPPKAAGEWPEGYDIEAIVAQQEVVDGRVVQIRFYPDGSSTGGSIRIQRPNGAGTRVRVDWLTGRVSQEPLDVAP